MYKIKKPMFIIAETPVHTGSGSDLGLVDLPIQRERHTGFPKIEASGLKGCIREAFESKKDKYTSLIFGPEEGDAYASPIGFTDARILLFPVKSLKGVFAWITCPMILEKIKKDLGIQLSYKINAVPENSELLVNESIVLEEYTYKVTKDKQVNILAKILSDMIFPNEEDYKFWKEKLQKDLVILSDDDFTQFVKTSTEIITRTKIDEKTGTVKSGALWTEEYLPQDTILYSLAMFSDLEIDKDEKEKRQKFVNFDDFYKEVIKKQNQEKIESKDIYDYFNQNLPPIIQIGGNQTIGKGIVRINFKKEEVENVSKSK